jgi:hypothetical protein
MKSAAPDHALPLNDPIVQHVPDDTGAAIGDIPAVPPFEYNSSDDLSQIGSTVSAREAKCIADLQEYVGFVSVEGTADSHGHSPTAVANIVDLVKKTQKKRTKAKSMIHDLHARLTKLEQGAEAANVKAEAANVRAEAADVKIANHEDRLKKIELDFDLRQLMTRVNEKTCKHLNTKSLARAHNEKAIKIGSTQYYPKTL